MVSVRRADSKKGSNYFAAVQSILHILGEADAFSSPMEYVMLLEGF